MSPVKYNYLIHNYTSFWQKVKLLFFNTETQMQDVGKESCVNK